MFRGFVEVLSVPQSKRLIPFGFLARSPLGMRILAVLLFVEFHTGSYVLAGLVTGAMTVAQALIGPVLGRAVDTYGAARVLLVTACGHTIFGTAFAVAVLGERPTVGVVILVLLTGATIAPVGAIVRGRWARLLHQKPSLLRTAYSVESSVDEIIYIGGPIVAVALAHSLTPTVGYLATLGLTFLGSLALCSARVLPGVTGTRRLPSVAAASPFSLALWKTPGFAVLLVGYAGLGVFLGAVDVAVVASTEAQSGGEYAGVMLGVLGIASLCSAIGLGALPPGWDLRWVRPISGLLIACACLGAFWLDSLVLLTLLLAVAGLGVSPTLVLGAEAMRAIATSNQVNEAFTWSSSTITACLGLGSFAAGTLTDTVGAHWGFLVAAAAGILTAFSGLRHKRQGPAQR